MFGGLTPTESDSNIRRKKSRTAEELQCGLAEEETRLIAKLVTGKLFPTTIFR